MSPLLVGAWKGLLLLVWKGLAAVVAAAGSLEPNTLLSDLSELADDAAVSKEDVAKGEAAADERVGCVAELNEKLGVVEAKAANGLATEEAEGAGNAAAKGEADEEVKPLLEKLDDESLSAEVRPDRPNASPALLGDANEKEELVAEEDAAAKGEANDDVVGAASELPNPNDGAVEANDDRAADEVAGVVSTLAGVLSAATDDAVEDNMDGTDEEAEADVEVDGAEKEKDGAAADVEKEKEGAAADVENAKEVAEVEKAKEGAAAVAKDDIAGAAEELLVVDVVDAALLAVEAAVKEDDVLSADGADSAGAEAVVGLAAAGATAVVLDVAAGLAGLEGTGTAPPGGGEAVSCFLFERLGDSGRTRPDDDAPVAADGDVAVCASLGRDGLVAVDALVAAPALGMAALPIDGGDRGERAGLDGSLSFFSTVSTGATVGGALN